MSLLFSFFFSIFLIFIPSTSSCPSSSTSSPYSSSPSIYLPSSSSSSFSPLSSCSSSPSCSPSFSPSSLSFPYSSPFSSPSTLLSHSPYLASSQSIPSSSSLYIPLRLLSLLLQLRLQHLLHLFPLRHLLLIQLLFLFFVTTNCLFTPISYRYVVSLSFFTSPSLFCSILLYSVIYCSAFSALLHAEKIRQEKMR